MSYYDDLAEEAPVADHQGILGTCVCFASTKAVMNGHETKKFYKEEAIDFNQEAIKTAFVNEFKVS